MRLDSRETQKRKGTCLGCHAGVLRAVELAHWAAGPSLSIFSMLPHYLKEKCQSEAQKVTWLVGTVMDDYVFSESSKKRMEEKLV